MVSLGIIMKKWEKCNWWTLGRTESLPTLVAEQCGAADKTQDKTGGY